MRLRDRRIQTSYPVRLTCQAIAFPPPTITWSSPDGRDIIGQNGELVISSSKKKNIITDKHTKV